MEQQHNSNGRDQRFDIIKGVCIFLVVWGHLPRVGLYRSGLETLTAWIYTFHMPMFLIISGYFFSKNCFSLTNVAKVFNRLLKPFFCMAIIQLGLYVVARRLGVQTTSNGELTGLMDFVMHIVKGYGGGALWYLYAVGLCELAVLLAFKFVKNTILACLVAVSVMFIGSRVGFNIHFNLLGWFFVGYCMRRVNCNFDFPLWTVAFVVAVGWIVGLTGDIVKRILWVLTVFCAFMAVANVVAERFPAVRKGLAWLGRHTLSILLFHNIISCVFRPLTGLILNVEPTGISVNVLFSVMIISMCIGLEWCIRRTFLKKLFFVDS